MDHLIENKLPESQTVLLRFPRPTELESACVFTDHDHVGMSTIENRTLAPYLIKTLDELTIHHKSAIKFDTPTVTDL